MAAWEGREGEEEGEGEEEEEGAVALKSGENVSWL